MPRHYEPLAGCEKRRIRKMRRAGKKTASIAE